MSVVEFLVAYFIIWWISLFMVLPFGVRKNKSKVAGVDPGAPAKARIGKKMLANSLLALIFTGILYLAIHFEVVDLFTLVDKKR